jgi:hypothetical protein
MSAARHYEAAAECVAEFARNAPNPEGGAELIAAWQDYATVLDVEGVVDELDDNDAGLVISGVLADMMINDCQTSIRRRAAMVETYTGKEIEIHSPALVAAALRRAADLADVPISGPMPSG